MTDSVNGELHDRLRDRGEASGLQRARAESPPETAAVKHGLHLRSGVGLRCENCKVREECPDYAPDGRCALEAEYIPDRRRQLARLLQEDGHDPADFAPLIEGAVWAEIRWARATRYIDVHGEIRHGTDGPDYTGVAKEARKLRKDVVDALEALNLSPAARAKLAAQRQGGGGGGGAGWTDLVIEAEVEAEES